MSKHDHLSRDSDGYWPRSPITSARKDKERAQKGDRKGSPKITCKSRGGSLLFPSGIGSTAGRTKGFDAIGLRSLANDPKRGKLKLNGRGEQTRILHHMVLAFSHPPPRDAPKVVHDTAEERQDALTGLKSSPCDGKHPHIWAKCDASLEFTFRAIVSSIT